LICIWWTRAHLLTTEQTGGAVRAINDRPYEIVGKLSLTNTIPLRLTVETPHPFGCGVFVPVEGFEK